MRHGSLGAFLYPDNFSPNQLVTFARRFEELGYAAVWYPEALVYESFTLGGYLLSNTNRITIASGIANIYARDPMSTVQASRALEAFYPGRYITGLGVSHPTLVSDIRGHAYGQPVATMRRYLDAMDASRPHVVGHDTPVVLGALGPRMSALGAERCAGVHPFNAPPTHTRRTREELGPDAWICTAQHVCMSTDPVRARAAARKALEFYFITPNYQRNWLSLGYDATDFAGGGSDRLVDALVAWGTETEIRARINQHFDAGATQVIINTIHPDNTSTAMFDNEIAGQNFQSAPHWDVFEMLRPA